MSYAVDLQIGQNFKWLHAPLTTADEWKDADHTSMEILRGWKNETQNLTEGLIKKYVNKK